jgi:hypothetical protein
MEFFQINNGTPDQIRITEIYHNKKRRELVTTSITGFRNLVLNIHVNIDQKKIFAK